MGMEEFVLHPLYTWQQTLTSVDRFERARRKQWFIRWAECECYGV